MSRTLRVLQVTGVLVGLCAATGSAVAQTADELFDPQAVHEVRLFINSRDLAELRARFDENTYYPADLTWNGIRVRNAGVRSRGSGSRNQTKLGLRIDFDRYASGQRFLGLKSLVLDNLWQDPSMIAERAAMSFFMRMGQPAPRESFCRLFINNTYQGLYALVEEVEKPFLNRAYGESQGYLFEFHYTRPWHGEFLGDDLEPYKSFFEARTNTLEADSQVYGPIRDLFRQVNVPNDAVWRDEVARLVDLSQLVRYVAIETFLAEDDGYLGAYGMNNFYLYRPADTGVHRFIPWDKDNAFHDLQHAIFYRADENELFRRALAFSDLRALYLDVLEECARVAAEDDWLAAEIGRLAALADTPAREDGLKQYSTDDLVVAVDTIRTFAVERPAFVLRAVRLARESDADR